MSFNGWYIPKSGSSKNRPEIRISKNFLSISRYCVNNYFTDKPCARIGYDKENNKIFIMPTTAEDKYGLTLIGKEEANFMYLNAKNFIEEGNLQPPTDKKSIKYDCSWDEEKKWLVIENVKQE